MDDNITGIPHSQPSDAAARAALDTHQKKIAAGQTVEDPLDKSELAIENELDDLDDDYTDQEADLSIDDE